MRIKKQDALPSSQFISSVIVLTVAVYFLRILHITQKYNFFKNTVQIKLSLNRGEEFFSFYLVFLFRLRLYPCFEKTDHRKRMFVRWLKVMLPDKTSRSRERQKGIMSAGSSVYTIGMKSLPSLITMLIKTVGISKNLRGTFRLLLFLYGFLLICDHDVQGWKEEGGVG